jgi:hypothetical protein
MFYPCQGCRDPQKCALARYCGPRVAEAQRDAFAAHPFCQAIARMYYIPACDFQRQADSDGGECD